MIPAVRHIREKIADQRGVALLLTLGITAALIVVSLETNRRVRGTVYAMATGRDRTTLAEMAVSGIHGAMALLAADAQVPPVDTPLDDWANPEIQKRLMAAIPFEDGTVNVVIEDERSRIQVNALIDFSASGQVRPAQRRLLLHLFDSRLSDLDETGLEIPPEGMVDALKDWLDDNDDDAVTGLYGAENTHYQSLDSPHPCANRRIVHCSEMQRIRGFNDDRIFSPPPEGAGLARYLTARGMTAAKGNAYTFDGKININTASAPVIAAMLPEAHRDLAPAIVEYRRELVADGAVEPFADPFWYRQAPGCGDLKIPEEIVTLSSDLFRIRSTATVHETEFTVTAVIQRQTGSSSGKGECRILVWEES